MAKKDEAVDQDRGCIAPELIREYIAVRHRLDAAEAILNERFEFRAEAEASMKASEAVEGALKSVLETQKARIRDLTKEIEKYSNVVESRLRQMPDFMIVSVTHAGNLQVCGECPTPADLHRHSGFYDDHVHIKDFSLYAKIEFPFEDEDTMAVMCPEPMKSRRMADWSGLSVEVGKPVGNVLDLSGKAGEGNTMPEEKPEEKKEEPIKRDKITEEPGKGRNQIDPGQTEDGIQIEIEEVGPEPAIPYLSDEWKRHLDKYRDVLELCYDRALSVCVMPDIAGKMALAMYASIVSSPNAAYREFLDAMQVYMERIAPEPREPLEAVPFPTLLGGPLAQWGVAPSPDLQKPSEPRQNEGAVSDMWIVITKYTNGRYNVSYYHEDFGGVSGKEQAIKCYRELRDHPSVERAYLAQNISDQVPAQDEPVTEEAKPDVPPGQYLGGKPDQEKEIKPPAEKPEGEDT